METQRKRHTMSRMNKIGSTATNIRTENGETIVRYHSTDVVRFTAKKIVLNSGGWFTSTTKNRMNQTARQFDLGYGIYQLKGNWYVSFKGKTLGFENGITLNR